MLLLAIDTCDSRGSLALLRDETVLNHTVHEGQEEYSSWLMGAVDREACTRSYDFQPPGGPAF